MFTFPAPRSAASPTAEVTARPLLQSSANRDSDTAVKMKLATEATFKKKEKKGTILLLVNAYLSVNSSSSE